MIVSLPTTLIVIQYDQRGGKVNPRRALSDTTDLQASIAEIGQTTPIEVGTANEEGLYPLYAGETRLVAIRRLYEATKDERYTTIQAIIRDGYGDPRLYMLATGVQNRYKRSEMADSVYEAVLDGNTIERIARIAGLSERDIPAYAALHGASETVRSRVDRGEIAWTTWCKLASHMSRDDQETLAQMENPTMKNTKKFLAEQQAERAEQAILPGVDMRAEEIIGQLHEVEKILRDVMAGQRAWPDEYRVRIEHRLETIASFVHGYTGGTVVLPDLTRVIAFDA
jgi:ParB-like chromosome segregation protein Spo0J